MQKILFFTIILGCLLLLCELKALQAQESNLIESLMRNRRDLFDTILRNPAKYKVQIIYTQINRNRNNVPQFKTFKYRVNRNEYFYPASTVKLPTALVALEKLNKLKIEGLSKYSRLRIGAEQPPQTAVTTDSTSPTGYPSIAHYIHKLFVVSDNDAYNRLYEFVGQETLNRTLWQKGYRDVQIVHRLGVPGFNKESNRFTNPFTFYNSKNKVIYEQAAVYNPHSFKPKIKNAKLGKAYIEYHEGKKRIIPQPMNMEFRNYLSLEAMHEMLKAILFPEVTPTQRKFLLSEDDYQLLYKAMSGYPSESEYPKYDSKEYKDNYNKFLMFGDKYEKIPRHIRVFNKTGLAYGFVLDNAYIVDFENKIEFLLSAVIYVNENEILNDDNYEYKTIGLPFMERLGRVIYWHERSRKRPYPPDLSKFKLDYRYHLPK
ncbi:MAG: class A beta-lactamase-related serine hydrolase [Microscillaceae bacterium]|nr:class A beta-lactamase-related serine hydrolase [Microscillaceae bacterium]MDW8459902.1 serine hydrolase [Cytophagales bacterium]